MFLVISDSEHNAQPLITSQTVEKIEMASQESTSSAQFVCSSSSKVINVWTFIEKNKTAHVNRCHFCM
jgi:hypothetical protein